MPTPEPQVVEADWTWTGDRFAAGIQVHVGADGRIGRVGRLGLQPTTSLRRRALLPGMISAHSHAFQRGLRGRGETFPGGAGSFWSWREAMYELAGRLGTDELETLCRQTFGEMRSAGMTAVGEFHYLHHAGPDAGYALDAVVLRAAAAVGIRIVLLNSYYRTGGVGRPLAASQRRFGSPSPAAFWEQMDRLAAHVDPATQSLGAAVHSLRAATPEELAAVYGEARRRGMAVHLHLEEQRQEIEEVQARYGRGPMEVVLATLPVADGLTAVHCTHTAPADLNRFFAAGGMACICPLTEANLGDGLPDLRGAERFPGRLCLGTDSNARISPLEEMRWLEYGQRLRGETRGALRDKAGTVARTLLDAATAAGARSLGLPAGRIEPGCWADLAAIDLDAPTLAGWEPDTLLESLIFGAGEETIAATAVGGRWRERDEVPP
jgi:formimidoylglutamate deiminase